MLPSLLPKVGMEFKTIDEAWMFWISYGGQKGFEVRKRYANKRKDGTIRSCNLVLIYMIVQFKTQFAIYAICKVIAASYTIKTCPVSFWKIAFGSVVQM